MFVCLMSARYCLLSTVCLHFGAISVIARAVQGPSPKIEDLYTELTRGAYIDASRLALAAVVALLCVVFGVIVYCEGICFIFYVTFFPANAHGLRYVSGRLASMTVPLVIVLH